MKTYRNIGITLLTGALLLAGFAGNALAWSSAACSTISNRAYLTFSVGGQPQGTLESSPVGNSTLGVNNGADTTFTVDTLVDLSVDRLASPVNATGVNQVLRFRITNLGNDTQQYQLQLYSGATPADDDFDMSNVRLYVDANDNQALDIPGDTLIAVGGFGVNLGLTGDVLGAVGANFNTVDVFVVADVPAGQPSNDTSAYALKAITHQSVANGGGLTINGSATGAGAGTEANNGCGNPVVVGDGDSDATKTAVGGVTDDVRDGAAYDSAVYNVVAAGVSVQKTQTVIWDPVNGAAPAAQPIPGAYVRYDIIISNAALAAPATLTQITDALVAQLAFDADLATAGPTTFEDALGNGFKVTHVSGRALLTPSYYTSTNADADGASEDGAGNITAIFATLLPAEAGPPAYAAGELKGGESVTLTFNAVIQ